jgi:hypothetical protein
MKPGDFPLGSERSRAAARFMLEQRTDNKERLEFILGSHGDIHKPRATEWYPGQNADQVVRMIHVPYGMTIATALESIGGYSEHELEEIATRHPDAVMTGFLAELRR